MGYNEVVCGGLWGKVARSGPKIEARWGALEQMFLGEFVHTIDRKGRLTLPAKFRPGLASGVVVTRGMDRCLVIYPMAEWERLSQRISALPITDKRARDFRRLVFSGAADVMPDRQGRILIPAYLREYANLDGEVVVAGLNTYIEVWNPQAWQEVRQSVEDVTTNLEQWASLEI